VAWMQQIKTAVCENDCFACLPQSLAFGSQLVERQDFCHRPSILDEATQPKQEGVQSIAWLYSIEPVFENAASTVIFLRGVYQVTGINDPKAIETILNESHTIAVVGLSSNSMRPSLNVARYLQQNGYRIIPVNPNETEVLGEKAYASLAEVPEKIDLVDIFRRSEEAGHHVDEAIRLGVKAVWMQDGVIDMSAAERAVQAGLLVVMDDCILRRHARRR